jgi:hypothetical protein
MRLTWLPLLAVALLAAGVARASAPAAWTLDTAETAVQNALGAGDECVPVGPRARQGNAYTYGAFACALFLEDGTQQLVAIAPASRVRLDYRTLHPAAPSPGAGPVPAQPGFSERIIAVDPERGAVELVDQSVWQVADTRRLASWRPGDRVEVALGDAFDLVDLTRHGSLEARFRGFDV